MLKISTYSQQEMVEIFNTSRIDNIKRSLTTLGFGFEVEGRGKKALFHITETPSEFKLFAIKELGFAAQTNFVALEAFLYAYFCDENFSNLMLIDMKEILNDVYGIEVSQQTISRWIGKLISLDLIHEGAEFVYYSTIVSYITGERTRETEQITHEQFVDAWKAYWDAMRRTHSYNDAYFAMAKIAGGKVFKVAKRENNAFTISLLERLISILTN